MPIDRGMDPPGTVEDIDGAGDALELEDVKKIASEENYELIYFSKESRLISFQPGEDSSDNEDDNRDNGVHKDHNIRGTVRINVYWGTGTVGTCLDHPARGKTQVFRRNVGLRMLGKIFGNPTGAYYRGVILDDGGTEIQGAEPDVPPEDRDPIDLLQEKNQMLQERLNHMQDIEITGPRGHPLYAKGSFRDGRWLLKRGGLWGVDLEMAQYIDIGGEADNSETIIAISAVNDIEIRLGGIIYASATSHEVFAQMDDQDWDGPSRKEVLCHFGGPVTGVWLPLRIDGWPQSHWSAVQRRASSRRKNEYRENLEVYEVLLDEVSDLYPEANISFTRLSFFGGCVEQMVDNLGLAPQSEVERQEEEELWNIANLIVTQLRSAGNDDIGEAFMKRVNDLQLAAYYTVQMATLSNEEVEAEIPKLVQMQLASHSTADFLFQVQISYSISSLSGN